MTANRIFSLILITMLIQTGISTPHIKETAHATQWTQGNPVITNLESLGKDIASAVDSVGNIYVAYTAFLASMNGSALYVRKSNDSGVTWVEAYTGYYSPRNHSNPSIAVNPFNNDVFIAVEIETTIDDHDICLLRYTNNEWGWTTVAVGPYDDVRNPDIVSESHYESANRQYIVYEQNIPEYDIKALEMRSSTNDGSTWNYMWSIGNWYNTLEVYRCPSIATDDRSIYVAYQTHYLDSKPIDISVYRITPGVYYSPLKVDGLPNDCQQPDIVVARGRQLVVVGFQYEQSENNTDIYYSYSLTNGNSWETGSPLLASSDEDESIICLTVDGEGTESSDPGYIHAIAKVGVSAMYTRASAMPVFDWTSPTLVGDQVGNALSVGVHMIEGVFYPLAFWSDATSTNIYFSSGPPSLPKLVIPEPWRPDAVLAVRGLNDLIYVRYYNSSQQLWGDWIPVPRGSTFEGPDASIVHGKQFFFVKGPRYGFYTSSMNLTDGSSTGWEFSSPFTWSTSSTVASNGEVIILVNWDNYYNKVHFAVFDPIFGAWAGGGVIPDGATSDEVGAALIDDTLHIVVRGFDRATNSTTNSLWHCSINIIDGSFSGWDMVPGESPSPPTLVSTPDQSGLYLVVRGMNDAVYYTKWNGTWGSWSVIPNGSTVSSPAAIVISSKLHVVVLGSDGSSLWEDEVDLINGSHTGWMCLEGATSSRPSLS